MKKVNKYRGMTITELQYQVYALRVKHVQGCLAENEQYVFLEMKQEIERRKQHDIDLEPEPGKLF